MARRSDISLSQEAVVDAGCRLLDQLGLEGVTMRAVGAALDVEAPALYVHVRNKNALLGMMVRRMYWQTRAGLDPCKDAREFLLGLGLRLQATFNECRDAARLFALSGVPDRLDGTEARRAIAPLVDFGLSEAHALEAHSGVMALCLGWALYRHNEPITDFLSETFDVTQAFERSLVLLVDGYLGGATARIEGR